MGNSISNYRSNLAAIAGAKAARAGKSRDANNRQRGTVYFDDWNDGYDHAEQEMREAARHA